MAEKELLVSCGDRAVGERDQRHRRGAEGLHCSLPGSMKWGFQIPVRQLCPGSVLEQQRRNRVHVEQVLSSMG